MYTRTRVYVYTCIRVYVYVCTCVYVQPSAKQRARGAQGLVLCVQKQMEDPFGTDEDDINLRTAHLASSILCNQRDEFIDSEVHRADEAKRQQQLQEEARLKAVQEEARLKALEEEQEREEAEAAKAAKQARKRRKSPQRQEIIDQLEGAKGKVRAVASQVRSGSQSEEGGVRHGDKLTHGSSNAPRKRVPPGDSRGSTAGPVGILKDSARVGPGPNGATRGPTGRAAGGGAQSPDAPREGQPDVPVQPLTWKQSYEALPSPRTFAPPEDYVSSFDPPA